MTTLSYQDLVDAFDFVSVDGIIETHAYIAKDTGKIYWVSGDDNVGDELPEDLDDENRYLRVPDKRELDLGAVLVMQFASREVPHLEDGIRAIFSRRGAYSRFKDLLSAEGVLDNWYAFEAEAVERALKEWGEANGIQVR
jgi:Uncharacterised protein family (UPF0158)